MTPTVKPLFKDEIDKVVKPIIHRVTKLEEADKTHDNNIAAVRDKVNELKGNMDSGLAGLQNQLKENNDNNNKRSKELEESFVKYTSDIQAAVENSRTECAAGFQKLDDIFDIGGHSDKAFDLKVFIRALRTEMAERQQTKAADKSQVRRWFINSLLAGLLLIFLTGFGTLAYQVVQNRETLATINKQMGNP